MKRKEKISSNLSSFAKPFHETFFFIIFGPDIMELSITKEIIKLNEKDFVLYPVL